MGTYHYIKFSLTWAVSLLSQSRIEYIQYNSSLSEMILSKTMLLYILCLDTVWIINNWDPIVLQFYPENNYWPVHMRTLYFLLFLFSYTLILFSFENGRFWFVFSSVLKTFSFAAKTEGCLNHNFCAEPLLCLYFHPNSLRYFLKLWYVIEVGM